MSVLYPKLLLSLCLISSLLTISLQFTPSDKYLINCGSSKNTTIGGRVFTSDSTTTLLSTPNQILINTAISGTNISSSTTYYASDLYSTARVFTALSHYTFPITKPGRHLVRLYFYPFTTDEYNLSTAKFSVSCQNFTLLSSTHLGTDDFPFPSLKEYSINVTSSNLVLTFTPSTNSFAYLNALEIISVPDTLIPDTINTIGTQTSSSKISMPHQALETVVRLNMGNRTVYPQNDTLSRLWAQDGPYLKHNNLVKFVTDVSAVNYTSTGVTDSIAPPLVYGTASRLNSELDPTTRINMTWSFKVDPGFHYVVRFHFCDIVKLNTSQGRMIFAIYINSWAVDRHYDLSNHTSDVLAAPHYLDVVVETSSNDNQLNVSIGPAELDNAYPNGLLNGLELMKLNDSTGSLVLSDAAESDDSTKWKIILIASLSSGALILAVVISVIVFLMCRRRRKCGVDGDHKYAGNAIMPKAGYRFPLSHIRELTDNFSESLVIGVGGFGKVYKGVLKDGTVVAVKRGSPDSQQGLAEFRTELEMLSQFRHRHLVSLIGYCDEQSELIIVYEYMENGTLKGRLYGSDYPKLSWKQRLEICIGSARGLHYLHTGSTKAIIHRDVKSANILLDENLMAKVADFGLSKTGPEIDQTHVSTAVKGSFGYLDPEYLLRQQLTEKSDVYSFGVVLYEVLCGRPVIDPSRAREEVNLVELAMKWQKRGEVEKIVDPNIAEEIDPECLKKVCETAEKCLAQCGLDRPSMGEVLWNLECALHVQVAEEEEEALEKQQSCGDGDVVIQIDEACHPLRASGSTARLSSLGSMGDMPDISMTAVFSEMTKRERS